MVKKVNVSSAVQSQNQKEASKGTMVVAMLGEWSVLNYGVWDFRPKKDERCKCFMMSSRVRFEELVEIVRAKFLISPTKPVFLTYRCPEVMLMECKGSIPPASITSDDDVNFFETICSNIEKVCLCVTIGENKDVGVHSIIESHASGESEKGKEIVQSDGSNDDGSSYESDSEDGDWHNFALREGEDDVSKGNEPENPNHIVIEVGECSQNWLCKLDPTDSGEDAVMEDERVRSKSRPCVLETCAKGALVSVLLDKANLPRDAPPDYEDSVNGGVAGALFDLDYEGDSVFVGRIYRSKDAFKVKMAIHAIKQKFHFRTTRSTPTYVELLCISRSCLWRVYASMIDETGNFQIRKANFQHSCSIDDRRYYHRQATTEVIGEIMRDRFVGVRQGPRPGEIRKIMKQAFEVNISYWKAWHCREVAMEKAVGSSKGSYALLPSYLTKLGKANPGSIIELEMDNHNRDVIFKFLFLSFGASIRGWEYMRKVILLDGTHLSGRYGGCMLTASAQDGNFQIFPIAYGIVDSENDKSWAWFFSCLAKVVPDSHQLVFVSDRHGSIYSGLQKVYPMAGHGACVVHLVRNIAARFKGKRLPSLMAQAARKFGIDGFYKVFAEIEAIDKDCAEYLRRLGFAHWTRSHFIGMRYNVMTTNIAESLNNVLKEGRDFPIISLVESLRTSMMGWFARHRAAAETEKCALTPKVREKMEASFYYSTSMSVTPANSEEFQVQTKHGEIFIVDLDRKMCSCREFQMLMVPCSHALAAASEVDFSTEKLVGDVYYTRNWRAAYKGTIHPVPSAKEMDDVSQAFELKPPVTRRLPGHPKKLRILSTGEFKRQSKTRARLCTRCLRRGHNKASCKMPIRESALGL